MRIRSILIYGGAFIAIAALAIFIKTRFASAPPREHFLPNMLLLSPAFNNKEPIPAKFTCDGWDVNPELRIENIPAGAKSLALIVDDPDAPSGTFTHWTVWNIDPKTSLVKEESKPPFSREGETGFGRLGYGGPCPPSGTHRYFFRLYALDAMLDLPEGASRSDLEKKIEEHLIEKAELMGTYTRQ